jgi:YegS/Rv2252/BmrU family lipid kinase
LLQKMKRSACLIFNPVAGQGDPEQDLQTIRSILEPEIELDIQFTTAEVDADQLALAAVERGVDAIIASGGDGTLSAAATALVRSTIPFGVISRGTANAFANALGIPTEIEAACHNILAGDTQTVDAALCNGQPMVLLAGIGFEAETVERADREAKNRFGILAYVLAGVQQLQALKSFDVEIETEDKVVTLTAAAITVANAAPPTSVLAQGPAGVVVDDGFLDITVVAPANKAGAIAATYHLLQTALSGDATDRNDIGYLRAQRVKITTDPEQKVVLDGELFGTTPIEVECIPGGLTLFMPLVEEVAPVEKLEGLPNLVVHEKD